MGLVNKLVIGRCAVHKPLYVLYDRLIYFAYSDSMGLLTPPVSVLIALQSAALDRRHCKV